MQQRHLLSLAALLSTAAATYPRYVMYFDQYHLTPLPPRNVTAGITHVVTAFANSSIFATDYTTFNPAAYQPFMKLSDIRALFDPGVKVCMSVGGWGDTTGFRHGVADDKSRISYATNINSTLHHWGYDCVDLDWEYVAGNGADYKQVPNSALASEVETFPLLLQEVKAAIGNKELSIALPGKVDDMMAFTKTTVPLINKACDFFNVMTYDLMNRRQTTTTHHTSVNGSITTIQAYLDRGMSSWKMVLGIAFYAKYFTLAPGSHCFSPTGCPTAQLEDPTTGSDTGKSGAMTFEAANFAPPPNPATLKPSPDGSCGGSSGFQCSAGNCCSKSGFCGATAEYCGTGCQVGFGQCTAKESLTTLFQIALRESRYDVDQGGQWFIDQTNDLYWTWDTPEIIARKFTDIVKPFGLGGVMAWSLVEDSHDWSHILALQAGVQALAAGRGSSGGCATPSRKA